MIWSNHRLTATAIAFAMTGHIVPMIFAYQGSVIPDAVEGMNFEDPNWIRNHRKISHYWILYLLPVIFSTCYLDSMALRIEFQPIYTQLMNDSFAILPFFAAYAIQWLAIGSLIHICGDFFCGTVPGLFVEHRIGIRMFYVGTASEYVFAAIIVFFALLLRLVLCKPFYLGI